MEKRGQVRGNGKMIWFLVNLVFGLYLLNFGFNFIDLSKIIPSTFQNWIIGIGGALIIIHGVMALTRRTPYPPRYR
jgi:hypothetical protein